MTAEDFGTLPDGRGVARVTLGAGRLQASVLTWGATVQDLRFDGQRVVIGGDRIGDYLDGLCYAGAIVGRYANRIGGARFTLDGETWQTDRNFRERHTLHGGAQGTGTRLWTLAESGDSHVRLSLDLPNGDMGFPGALRIAATYRLLPPATLEVRIEAQTTRATPCSLAHHGYFVLDGAADIASHRLQIDAGGYLPVDRDLIPTGEVAPVAGTRFDFRSARQIGSHGYDHNFCLGRDRRALTRAARVTGPQGMMMTVATTEPGLQVYDGAHLGGVAGYGGHPLAPRAGLALETQAWPDSPNRPGFPDCILRPGQTWQAITRYAFA